MSNEKEIKEETDKAKFGEGWRVTQFTAFKAINYRIISSGMKLDKRFFRKWSTEKFETWTKFITYQTSSKSCDALIKCWIKKIDRNVNFFATKESTDNWRSYIHTSPAWLKWLHAHLSFSTISWKKKHPNCKHRVFIWWQPVLSISFQLYGIKSGDNALQFWRNCHVTLLINDVRKYERNLLWHSSTFSKFVLERVQSRIFFFTFLVNKFEITLYSVCSTFKNFIRHNCLFTAFISLSSKAWDTTQEWNIFFQSVISQERCRRRWMSARK